MPGPACVGDLSQGLAMPANFLGERAEPFGLMPSLFPLGLITSGVGPVPGVHGVSPIGVLGDMRLPQFTRDVGRCPAGLALIGGPPGQQLAIRGRRDLAVLLRHPQRGIGDMPARSQLWRSPVGWPAVGAQLAFALESVAFSPLWRPG